MPLERAASNHTRVESFNYWGSRRFLSRRIKTRVWQILIDLLGGNAQEVYFLALV